MIICTRNRASYLADAIRSIQEQDFPSNAFEIVIVDNGSTDDTRQVVPSFGGMGIPCVYVSEPVLGLPRARNTGARASRGEILAYIDDDALAERDWLKELAAAYQEVAEKPVIVGGKSELLWEGERPSWITDELLPYLSDNTHLGEVERVLGEGEYPVGVNMSIRREQLQKYGGFDTSLRPYGNDEVELCQRLRASGGEVVYVPQARVRHRVSVGRVTIKYFMDRFFRQGAADVVLEQKIKPQNNISSLKTILSMAIIFIDGIKFISYFIIGQQNQSYKSLFTLSGRLGRLKIQTSMK